MIITAYARAVVAAALMMSFKGFTYKTFDITDLISHARADKVMNNNGIYFLFRARLLFGLFTPSYGVRETPVSSRFVGFLS